MDNPEGQQLGDYTIIKSLGQGTLGTVYLVEHRFMKRHYALKVLPESLASDRSFMQRFQAEVSALSALDHPNVVRIHNVSSVQGKYFLVMDCVVDELGEMTNLAHYLAAKGDALPEAEVVAILKQVAQALDYAHGKGVVHGGLKLNNVLVSEGATEPTVKLTDLGLTPIIGMGALLTRTVEMVAEAYSIASHKEGYPVPPVEKEKLTPLHGSFYQNWMFLAPEQRLLGEQEMDTKMDTYAFGVLAYFLTTGTYPDGHYAPPSEVMPRYKLNWDHLVNRCLAQDASKRPETLQVIMQTSTVSRQEAEKTKPPQITPPPTKIPQKVAKQEPVLVGAGVAVAATELKPQIQEHRVERPEYDPDPLASLQVDPIVKQYRPEEPEAILLEPIQTDMVIIEGGEFRRGSNEGARDEMSPHIVYLNSFAIDIHPVTNEQFVRFLETMGGDKDSLNRDLIRQRESRIKRKAGSLSIESGYSKHPVVGVTWYGATAYAKWVGKRLPTEAEWETAAIGGLEGITYPAGNDIEKKEANFFSSDSTVVMSYAPNGYGLFDMAGNVYEWCHDWYGYNYYETSEQEPDNPRGPIQGVYRVLRGGCWKSLKEDLRCSHRHRNNPGTFNGTYGFRCAVDVEKG